MKRIAEVSRVTGETEVAVTLNLDGTGQADVQTGLGMLDHLLTNFAVHGLFDLRLAARGDLHVDAHHTVEDTALCLGIAFDQALGERRGIVRIADSFVPMDEALAHVVIDLSGRPYAALDVRWNSPAVGAIPTSVITHFFESLAVAARCNLHARLLYGRDDHHQAEALFKACARALERATRLEPRRPEQVPSTKGRLT